MFSSFFLAHLLIKQKRAVGEEKKYRFDRYISRGEVGGAGRIESVITERQHSDRRSFDYCSLCSVRNKAQKFVIFSRKYSKVITTRTESILVEFYYGMGVYFL